LLANEITVTPEKNNLKLRLSFLLVSLFTINYAHNEQTITKIFERQEIERECGGENKATFTYTDICNLN
jgi:hypothetical protein